MSIFKSERELLSHMVGYLRDEQFTVYQEVSKVDIVATRGALLWAIEGKLTCNWRLVAQAKRNRAFAHQSFICVPWSRNYEDALHALKALGIGMFVIRWSSPRVQLQLRADFNRRIAPRLQEALRPEQQDYIAAGSPGGGGYTPWKSTCLQVASYVERHSGCSLKDVMSAIKHHYTTDQAASRSMAYWIKHGRVPGVRCEKIGNKLLLFAATYVPAAG